MAAHYYSENPEAAHAPRTIQMPAQQTLRFETDAGVFSRAHVDPGSLLLLDAIPSCSGRVLDLGCGYGPIGIALAKANPDAQFVLADVNRRAVALCEKNIAQNDVENAVAQYSDGCTHLDGLFDRIVSNPPIRIGKQALPDMWTQCFSRLNNGGDVYIVIRKKQGAKSAKVFLTQLFGNCETVKRGGGYHVLVSRKA